MYIVATEHFTEYIVAFDGEGEWSFRNDYTTSVIIFCVDNSSSSHTDNLQNNFLILGEGDILVLMEALVHQKKSLVLILVKQIQNFAGICLMLIIAIC